jgi:PIN domain nuclease of toxin-antitoxin system
LRLLLDTCTFLWLTASPERVPADVRESFQDARNTVHFSVASAWEISIKHKLGQLRLPDRPERYLSDRIARYNLTTIDVGLPHAIRAGALPFHHKDPFDRMLIAQAALENLTIATPDPAFAPYGVPLIW